MKHINLIIAIGLLISLIGCNSSNDSPAPEEGATAQPIFVTESNYNQNRTKQISGAPQVIQQLRNMGVTDRSKLKLEYFFYTNDIKKAELLTKELAGLGYEAGLNAEVGIPGQIAITGWTTRMTISNESVVQWAGQMCDLGYKFDCEFDGWGTNPNQ